MSVVPSEIQTDDGWENEQSNYDVKEDEDGDLQDEGPKRRNGYNGRGEKGAHVANWSQQDANAYPF